MAVHKDGKSSNEKRSGKEDLFFQRRLVSEGSFLKVSF